MTCDGNEFALRMFRELRSPPGNLVFSGASLRSALGIAYLGARGETAMEMMQALAFAPDVGAAADEAKMERVSWERLGNPYTELRVANRLWTDRRYPLEADFIHLAEDAYGAPLDTVDFSDPDAAGRTINDWVAQQTRDRILGVLPTGSIDGLTRLVVTNAVYLKAGWRWPFAKQATRDESFHVDVTTTRKVPMMHQTETHPIAVVPEAKILALPYRGDLRMVVVLPEDPSGLATIEAGLSTDTFEQWTDALREEPVHVSLPKFTFEWAGTMRAPLEALGMHAAFSGRADFSGIVDTEGDPPCIDLVRHPALIEVDELGTEAAAAAGVMVQMASRRAEPRPIAFTADHPFLFFICDSTSGRILFAGRVATPG